LAKIIYISKKGDKQDIQNCRPISVLMSFSKILEGLMYNKLISFVYELLMGEQFGFRDGKSTEPPNQAFSE
jgi:vacuolar-type H+-ATPase subunit I/STV1